MFWIPQPATVSKWERESHGMDTGFTLQFIALETVQLLTAFVVEKRHSEFYECF